MYIEIIPLTLHIYGVVLDPRLNLRGGNLLPLEGFYYFICHPTIADVSNKNSYADCTNFENKYSVPNNNTLLLFLEKP